MHEKPYELQLQIYPFKKNISTVKAQYSSVQKEFQENLRAKPSASSAAVSTSDCENRGGVKYVLLFDTLLQIR